MRPQCQQELNRRKLAVTAEKCRFCLLPINVHQAGTGICDDGLCRKLSLRLSSERSLREARIYERQIERLKEKLDRDADTMPLMVQVPVSTRSLGPVSEDRQKKFESRLRGLFKKMRQQCDPDANPPAAKPPSAVAARPDRPTERMLGNGCRTCRGYCCKFGEEHAFLKVENMRKLVSEYPQFTEEDIIARYLEQIPDESCVDSCIFHGENGCALPNNWRGTLCNEYFCVYLENFMARPAEEGQDVVFVATDKTTVIRAALCNEDTYLPVE
jgi:hypothetical protein